MLDELLRQVERMDTVVFYWLKGHSGAAPNEAADWYATEFLEEGVGAPVCHGTRRHASMTFAFRHGSPGRRCAQGKGAKGACRAL
eukprot:scaffold5852_cov100-Phaeocystis_antarctica.AAC.2